MTPQEHLRAAEAFLSTSPEIDDPSSVTMDIAMSVNALAHAVIALAAELGVPHAAGSAGAGSGG